MSLKSVFSIALLAGCSLWAADGFTPLDVKPGEWQVTMTSETTGTPPIPPEVLSRLTPDQRAKMEAMAKARAAKGPQSTTRKHCLKKEDLEKPLTFNDDKTCKATLISSSRTKQEMRFECAGEGVKTGGSLRLDAVNSENVKITTQGTMAGPNGGMTINTNTTAKWLSASCTESK